MKVQFFELLRQKFSERKYIVTLHAYNEASEEGLEIAEVRKAIIAGEVIEDYPEDARGHSCLVLGWIGNIPIHSVCGFKEEEAILITVYVPDSEKWIDLKVRRRSE
ncbi:MAG: DUF4258 domain-containing protein [bacterium]